VEKKMGRALHFLKMPSVALLQSSADPLLDFTVTFASSPVPILGATCML
jgi:hypothetical protein